VLGCRNMSFGQASKYVILSCDEICYLLRPKNGQNISFGWAQNFSFGRVLKIVNWLRVEYVIWSMSLGQASEYLKYSYIRRNYIIFFVLIPIKNLCM
jgi:hypothetical protein